MRPLKTKKNTRNIQFILTTHFIVKMLAWSCSLREDCLLLQAQVFSRIFHEFDHLPDGLAVLLQANLQVVHLGLRQHRLSPAAMGAANL